MRTRSAALTLGFLAGSLAACNAPRPAARPAAAAVSETTVEALGAHRAPPEEARRRPEATREPAASIVSDRVGYVDGLKEPESVIYDSAQQVYFVSNINGPSLKKDGNGFISRLRSDGTLDSLRWIESGRDSVELDAPKGMALVGDTLWVTDIDAVRGFNRQTGAPVGSIDLAAKASFLNDIATGPDGSLYVTDTELRADRQGNLTHSGKDRIFRIAPDRSVSIAMQSDRLGRPNGIAWDPARKRFLVVPFGGDTVFAWSAADSTLTPLVAGLGQLDGVTLTGDNRVLISNQSTSSVQLLDGDRLVKIIDHLPGCADIEYDRVHHLLAVPLTSANRVEFYRVP
ncbi:MAG: SMP-30/gluconolactonase/LRE family protein [Gemmatimonadota bacterium]